MSAPIRRLFGLETIVKLEEQRHMTLTTPYICLLCGNCQPMPHVPVPAPVCTVGEHEPTAMTPVSLDRLRLAVEPVVPLSFEVGLVEWPSAHPANDDPLHEVTVDGPAGDYSWGLYQDPAVGEAEARRLKEMFSVVAEDTLVRGDRGL